MRLPVKFVLIISFVTLTACIATSSYILSIMDIPVPKFFNLVSSNPVTLALFVLLIGALSCLIFFAWLVVKQIFLNQVEELKRVTHIIASGNLGVSVPVRGSDELGQLSENISTMTRNIAKALQSMANSLRQTKEKEQALARNVIQLEEARKLTQRTLEDLNKEKSMLQQTNAKDEALLTSIGDGTIAINETGRIIFANKEASQILGWDSFEAMGKLWHEILLSFDEKTNQTMPQEQQLVPKAVYSGGKISLNCSFMRKDRSLIPVAATASPIIINNNIGGVIVIFRDITKEKEIDRMKTEFISLASHQLRTPLAAIRWFSELLLDEGTDKLGKEQRDLVQNISDSAERMVDLVNALLNISRIESGRIIIDPKPTDLVTLAKQVITELEVKLREKNQKIIISAHEYLPAINIDPKLIRQVFINLLTNAIKYSPNGSETIIFISRKGEQIIVQISDNGYGIPEKEQFKIFQKFFRAENVVKVETDGTGLGLYLVKAIIESSQGKIWFKSKEGQGTTFWFRLPVAGTPAKKGEVTIDS